MTFTRRHILSIAAPLLAAALMAAPAHAKPGKADRGFEMKPALMQSYAPAQIIRQDVPQWAQSKISASKAKSIARSRHPDAKFVDISRKGDTWRVRLIKKDGRVVDVLIDANTGRVK